MARGADLGKETIRGSVARVSTAASCSGAIDDVDGLLANLPLGRGERAAGGAATAPGHTTGDSGRSTVAPAPKPTTGDKPAEPAPRGNAEPPPVDPISPRPGVKTEPPPVKPIATRPTWEIALNAYAAAMTRKDANALLAVFPSAPREVLEGFTKTDAGVAVYALMISPEKIR